MPKKLIIGTGSDYQKQEGVIGLDIINEFNPDIVRDILRGLPFTDNTFDEVEISHVLEHITGHLACKPTDNFDFVMGEIHRVLKPNGIVNIEVPYWKDDHAIESAGHVKFFNENSFVNYYNNPYGDVMNQAQFSEAVSITLEDTNRAIDRKARVVKLSLKK